MFTRTETYTDLNGVERTETAYFNLSKSELIQMEFGTTGGFTQSIQKMVEAQDTNTMIKVIKDLLLKAYGIKSADGRRFEKSPELATQFEQTEMFNIIFMDLVTNADKAADFINGVIPSDLADAVSKAQAEGSLPSSI